MTFEWVDHTAELELRIEAPTKEAVFADAVEALAELVGVSDPSDPVQLRVRAAASDDAALLAEFLSELIYLSETAQFGVERADDVQLGDGEIRATVTGRYGEGTLDFVKAVTYHGLEVRRDGSRWHARVVLDV